MLVAALSASVGQAVPSDSIYVDGRAIRVHATVEIDTVSRPRRWQFGWNVPGPDEGRPIKRKAPAWNALYAAGRLPFDVRQPFEGTPLDAFTGGLPNPALAFGWSRIVPRPGARPWGFGWAMEGQWMAVSGFDGALPDSLIGFLAGSPNEVLAVTRERFEIGVETDTVAVRVGQSSSWSGAALAVLQAELVRQIPITLSFGLERWSTDRPSIRVSAPGAAAPPLLVRSQPGAAWQPVARVGASWAWGRRGRRGFSGAWSAGAFLTWRPAEDRTWSARLQVTRVLAR